jgi:hypothetical protein
VDRIRAVAPTLHLHLRRESWRSVVPLSSANARIYHWRPGVSKVFSTAFGASALVQPLLYQNVKSNVVRQRRPHDNSEMTPDLARWPLRLRARPAWASLRPRNGASTRGRRFGR